MANSLKNVNVSGPIGRRTLSSSGRGMVASVTARTGSDPADKPVFSVPSNSPRGPIGRRRPDDTYTAYAVAPIKGGGEMPGDITFSIDPATAGNPGSMSPADKAKLDAATDSADPQTLVRRDGNGNLSANVVTADLAGRASSADVLNQPIRVEQVSGLSDMLSGMVPYGRNIHVIAPLIGGGNLGSGDLNIGINTVSEDADGLMPSTDKRTLDAATSGMMPSTIVRRDGSGGFSAGPITAGSITTSLVMASNAVLGPTNVASLTAITMTTTGASTMGDVTASTVTTSACQAGSMTASFQRWQLTSNTFQQGVGPPGDGQHVVGDIVWNMQPTAGGQVGWVCVTDGQPGLWKAFGTIDA